MFDRRIACLNRRIACLKCRIERLNCRLDCRMDCLNCRIAWSNCLIEIYNCDFEFWHEKRPIRIMLWIVMKSCLWRRKDFSNCKKNLLYSCSYHYNILSAILMGSKRKVYEIFLGSRLELKKCLPKRNPRGKRCSHLTLHCKTTIWLQRGGNLHIRLQDLRVALIDLRWLFSTHSESTLGEAPIKMAYCISQGTGDLRQEIGNLVDILAIFLVFTTRRVIPGADSRLAGKKPWSPYAGEFLLDL